MTLCIIAQGGRGRVNSRPIPSTTTIADKRFILNLLSTFMFSSFYVRLKVPLRDDFSSLRQRVFFNRSRLRRSHAGETVPIRSGSGFPRAKVESTRLYPLLSYA